MPGVVRLLALSPITQIWDVCFRETFRGDTMHNIPIADVRQSRSPPVATNRRCRRQKVLLRIKAFLFSRDESRALLTVFDTGNREKPRWKRGRFPMTQLVCHEDRTPNRVNAFSSLDRSHSSTNDGRYTGRARFVIKKRIKIKAIYRGRRDRSRSRNRSFPGAVRDTTTTSTEKRR